MRNYLLLAVGLVAGLAPGLSAVDLVITAPGDRQVVQRAADNHAWLPVRTAVPGGTVRVQTMSTIVTGGNGYARGWTDLDSATIGGGQANGRVRLAAGGWYQLDLRALAADSSVLATGRVSNVGVGELFVVAGQSNGANYGADYQLTPIHQTATEDRAGALAWTSSADGQSTLDSPNDAVNWVGRAWQHLADPVRPAQGPGGSTWPPFADGLVARLQVPVAVVPVGQGGSSSTQWLPPGGFFPYLLNAVEALGSVRAVLWHQGEADAVMPGASQQGYHDRLGQIIDGLAQRTGAHPWLVATVSYMPNNDPGSRQAVRAAQQQVVAERAEVYAGPDTDTLPAAWDASNRRSGDGIHLNALGLQDAGLMWRDAVLAAFPATLAPPTGPLGVTASGAAAALAVTWTDAAGDETAYRVEGSAGGAAWTSLALVPANSTNATVVATGFDRIRVIALSPAGSNASSVYLLAGGPPANLPPTAQAGNDQVIAAGGTSASLTGAGNDSDGSIVAYVWTCQAKPAAATDPLIATPAAANTVISGLVPGIYLMRLVVRDDQGAQAQDEMMVTVQAAVAVPAAPEVALERGGTAIANAATNAIAGTTAATLTAASYTLRNLGTAALTLGVPTISGASNVTASIATAPATAVAAGGSTTLILNVTPTAAGAWSCVVSLSSTDSDENPVTWTVSGTASAVAVPAAPEVALERSGTAIANAATSAITGTTAATLTAVSYTLRNLGTAALTLGVPAISGASNVTASVATAPATAVAAGGSTTLILNVTPTAAGAWSCIVSLSSTDSDENPVTWTVSGTADLPGSTKPTGTNAAVTDQKPPAALTSGGPQCGVGGLGLVLVLTVSLLFVLSRRKP